MSDNWADHLEEKYFNDLRDEVTGILVLWYQWEALFEQNEDRLARLKESGNLFFGSIERVFYRDVILGICRMTDEEHQGKSRNISILHFQDGVYKQDSTLQNLVTTALTQISPFRIWRNKRLSHIDVNTGIGWKPPQGCERGAVSQTLQAISAVLRHVSRTTGGTELLLGAPQFCPLKLAIRAQTEGTFNYLWRGHQAENDR